MKLTIKTNIKGCPTLDIFEGIKEWFLNDLQTFRLLKYSKRSKHFTVQSQQQKHQGKGVKWVPT